MVVVVVNSFIEIEVGMTFVVIISFVDADLVVELVWWVITGLSSTRRAMHRMTCPSLGEFPQTIRVILFCRLTITIPKDFELKHFRTSLSGTSS